MAFHVCIYGPTGKATWLYRDANIIPGGVANPLRETTRREKATQYQTQRQALEAADFYRAVVIGQQCCVRVEAADDPEHIVSEDDDE